MENTKLHIKRILPLLILLHSISRG
jgi:hypothetical protein